MSAFRRYLRRSARAVRTALRQVPLPVRQRLVAGRRLVANAVRYVVESPVRKTAVTGLRLVRRAPRAQPISRLVDRTDPLPLGELGTWYRIDADGNGRFLLTVSTAETLEPASRAGLIHYRYLNVWGLPFVPADAGKEVGDGIGAHDWIPRVPAGTESRYLVLVPRGAASVDVKLTLNPDCVGPVTVTSVLLEPLGQRRLIEPFDGPTSGSPRRDLRLAVIADASTLTALRLEADVVALSRRGWRRELESFRPDLVFVASVFDGNDGDWRDCIAGLRDDDTRVRELIGRAQQLGIPVQFWNNEDPEHYDDFLPVARLCDAVATTDVRMIPRYLADLGHDSVFALPFAVQPDIHNPRQLPGTSSERIPAAVFLGSSWSHEVDARRRAREHLFDGAIDYGLEIFDRHLELDDHERCHFDQRWLRFMHGTLGDAEVLNAYRRYSVVLDVNTVSDSPTMVSRQALEASACGAVVISNPSAGATEACRELVTSASTAEECRDALTALHNDPADRDRIAHRAYRYTHRHHSWVERLDAIAAHCNLALPSRRRPKVSVVMATMRPGGADRIIRYLASLADQDVELEPILICAFDPAKLTADAEIEQIGCRLEPVLPGEMLGDCLNRGASLATGGLIAKIDDDDLYGHHYFADLCLAIDHSRADIVGKNTFFQHFEEADTTVIRYRGREHRYTSFLCGATLLARADVYAHVRFPSERVGEDSEFLRRAVDADLTIYSADRFSYVAQRRADANSHTYRADHQKLVSSELSQPWCSGLPLADLDV